MKNIYKIRILYFPKKQIFMYCDNFYYWIGYCSVPVSWFLFPVSGLKPSLNSWQDNTYMYPRCEEAIILNENHDSLCLSCAIMHSVTFFLLIFVYFTRKLSFLAHCRLKWIRGQGNKPAHLEFRGLIKISCDQLSL